MITYFYWLAVLALTGAAIFVAGYKFGNWRVAALLAVAILLIGWGTYYFRLQQVFVKHYGGVMSIVVPEGQHHLGATWKDDNLWIENFDPTTNTCIFSEYSKGNLLQGKVTIKNCNPFLPTKSNNIK